METTYFNIIPSELIDIILRKLCCQPAAYDLIEALTLDEQKSYRSLSIHMCEYLSNIPLICKVESRKIFWGSVYNKLINILPLEHDSESVFRSSGLIWDKSDINTEVTVDQLLDYVVTSNELFLVLLYKFNNYGNDIHIRRLSVTLFRVIRLTTMVGFEISNYITNVIEYRSQYSKQVISTCKKSGAWMRMDI